MVNRKINFLSAVSSCSLAAVSFIRCLAIWTDNKCRLLEHHKTCLTFIWIVPTFVLLIFYYYFWSDDRHIRSSYVCSFFCGISAMQNYNVKYNERFDEIENEQLSNISTSLLTTNILNEDEYIPEIVDSATGGLGSLEIFKANQNIINHSDEEYEIPTWLFVLPPSLFNYVPLCILIVSYCMIWVKIKRSNVRIEGMVAFNKHKNEVRIF